LFFVLGALSFLAPKKLNEQSSKNKALSTKYKGYFILPPSSFILLIQGPWSRIHSTHAHLIDNSYPQILFNSNLAGQAHVGRELLFHCESISFELTHFTGITFQNLHSTSSATRIPATSMQDIYTSVLDHQHQLLLGWSFSLNHSIGSLCHDLRHQ
jgi:hypothetical protein